MRVLNDFRRKLRRRRRERYKIQLTELEQATQPSLKWSILSPLHSAAAEPEAMTMALDAPSVVEIELDATQHRKKKTVTCSRPHNRIDRAFRELERETRNIQPS